MFNKLSSQQEMLQSSEDGPQKPWLHKHFQASWTLVCGGQRPWAVRHLPTSLSLLGLRSSYVFIHVYYSVIRNIKKIEPGWVSSKKNGQAKLWCIHMVEIYWAVEKDEIRKCSEEYPDLKLPPLKYQEGMFAIWSTQVYDVITAKLTSSALEGQLESLSSFGITC